MFVVAYIDVKSKDDAMQVVAHIEQLKRNFSYDLMCSGCGEEVYKHDDDKIKVDSECPYNS